MSDFEERLRAALGSVAEQAPPGLLGAVKRRHRRRAMRLGAAAAALAVAIGVAVPSAAGALRGGHGVPTAGPGPRASRSTGLHAAPGTVLSDCGTGPANLGELGSNWRDGTVYAHAGPVWFLGGGFGHGPIRLFVSIVVLSGLKAGSTVVVRAAPAGRPFLRFLYGPADGLSPGIKYTMRSGEAGVTFEACPGHGPMPTPGITDYYGGFLVDGARCVPARVWVPGRATPYRIRLGVCSAR